MSRNTKINVLLLIAVAALAVLPPTPVIVMSFTVMPSPPSLFNAIGAPPGRRRRLAVFSLGGFTEALRREAAREEVVLVDGERLFGPPDQRGELMRHPS